MQCFPFAILAFVPLLHVIAGPSETRSTVLLNSKGEVFQSASLLDNTAEVAQESHDSDKRSTPSTDPLNNEVVDGWCNKYTCPNNYYKRVNAPDIKCAAEVCTEASDKNTCCKGLTKEVEKKKCRGSEALNWFEQWSLNDCVEWALHNGVSFFAYGTAKSGSAEKCWWQRAGGSPDCVGEDCCKCEGCKMEGTTYTEFNGICHLAAGSNYPTANIETVSSSTSEEAMKALCNSKHDCRGFQMNGGGGHGLMVGPMMPTGGSGHTGTGHSEAEYFAYKCFVKASEWDFFKLV